MAEHKIRIHKIPGTREVDTPSVPIRSGDTVTFMGQEGAASVLCLSAETAAIISPAPKSTSIEVPDGGSASFTLGEVKPGNYCVVVQAHGWPCPGVMNCEPGDGEAVLVVRGAHASDFPGPDDSPAGS